MTDLRTAREDKRIRFKHVAKLLCVIMGQPERTGNLVGDRDDDVLTSLGLADHQIPFVVL